MQVRGRSRRAPRSGCGPRARLRAGGAAPTRTGRRSAPAPRHDDQRGQRGVAGRVESTPLAQRKSSAAPSTSAIPKPAREKRSAASRGSATARGRRRRGGVGRGGPRSSARPPRRPAVGRESPHSSATPKQARVSGQTNASLHHSPAARKASSTLRRQQGDTRGDPPAAPRRPRRRGRAGVAGARGGSRPQAIR